MLSELSPSSQPAQQTPPSASVPRPGAQFYLFRAGIGVGGFIAGRVIASLTDQFIFKPLIIRGNLESTIMASATSAVTIGTAAIVLHTLRKSTQNQARTPNA